MAGSSFGQAFSVTTAGESHGPGNVAIVDGVPAGLELNVDDLTPRPAPTSPWAVEDHHPASGGRRGGDSLRRV